MSQSLSMPVAMLPTYVAPLAAAGLVLAGLVVLGRQRSQLGGTTLVAVWCWSIVGLTVIGLVEILIASAGGEPRPAWVMPLRLVAATASFCPVMALLGAKRPQDRGWQFVVVALWGILSLPSIHWLLLGGVREIHPAQLAFLAILIGVGVVNGLATRFWLSSVLYCCGQMALLAPFYPPTQAWLPDARGPLVGMALMVAAWTLLVARVPTARRAVVPLDRVWLDFRDAFGAVWGLRVMERMNASAAMYRWPVGLGWSGFCPRGVGRDEAADITEVPPVVEQSLRTLLRRFVSPQWIDERLGRTTDSVG